MRRGIAAGRVIMNGQRYLPPKVADVERRFRHPAVIVTRPLIQGSIGVLGVARNFSWQATGLDQFPDLELPVILAANHQSHADTAAILGTLPRRARERTAVAAALDVFGNGTGVPSFKRECIQFAVAAGFNAFAFDRHGPPLRSLRTAVHLMRNGWNLLLYPEGTRSRTGRMTQFKAGVSIVARFSRFPVIPVHVQGGRQVLPCGAFLPRAGRITVHYGKPIRFGRSDSLASFAARVERHVREAGA